MNKNEAVKQLVSKLNPVKGSVLEKLLKVYRETGDEEYMVREVTPKSKDNRDNCDYYMEHDCEGYMEFVDCEDEELMYDVSEFFKLHTPCKYRG